MITRPLAIVLALPATLCLAGGTDWPIYENQTATRLVSDPAVGIGDTQEKDYAWVDVDADGDTDVVVVRKSPWTTTGGRRNVLLLNEGGVLVDRTADLAPQLLDATNDRDVVLADVTGDGSPDIVTAVTLGGLAAPKSFTHPRIYVNRGLDDKGDWLGFVFDDVDRIPTFPFEPRFNDLAAGDIDSDGDLDLYFTDSDWGPYPRGGDLDDRLLANNGAGYFVDVTAAALAPGMADTVFGASVEIVDLNGDGFNDVVRVELGAGEVEVLSNAGDGTFDVMETVYSGAATHASAGHLDGDGLLDIVITDDGLDRHLLNQGNGADGLANFTMHAFGVETQGFGEESVITDIDGNGFNDVIITDVSVDIAGCSRVTDIIRNLGETPGLSFVGDSGGIPPSQLTGVHDVAVLDLNGDGVKDLVLGRCTGTSVWVSAAPCPWDLDGGGAVGIADLLALLAAWGTDPGGPPDFDGDGLVGITDLLAMLGAWGDCP